MRSIRINFPGLGILLLLILLLMRSMETEFKDLIFLEFSVKLLLKDILYSFLRVSLASVAAWISGIIAGYLLLNYTPLFNMLIITVNFVRHISPFAWLPFAIIWFGLGEAPISFIMFITLFFPTLIAAMNTFSNIPQEFLEEAQVLGATKSQTLFKIEIPLSLKDLLNTFRIIWGLGWTTIIAVEMLGVNSGMGFRILDFRYLLNYPAMIIYIIIMGIIGILIDYLLRKLIALFV
jgi:NitT/TauT family transport system permease protein